LPVALDEFEAQSDNQRAEGVLKLARIAASGGTVARVGGDGKVQRFKLRNCFLFSSILIPPLNAANRSRLAICELLPLSSDHGAEEGPEAVFDPVNAAKRDPILGAKEDWRAIGRMLRGRVIQHWARYHQTFQTYRHALLRAGHDTRAAEQFGSLGAAYDVAMYDALDAAAAKEWAAMLPSRTLAETSGYESEPVACLKHLLRAPLDLIRGGGERNRGALSARGAERSRRRHRDGERSRRCAARAGKDRCAGVARPARTRAVVGGRFGDASRAERDLRRHTLERHGGCHRHLGPGAFEPAGCGWAAPASRGWRPRLSGADPMANGVPAI
jgi:hypothetical protein